MNRQLTGLFAWGALALIVAVPSAEIFLSRSADAPDAVSTTRPEGAALSQTPAIVGSLEAAAPDQPAADMTKMADETADAQAAVPHDTALADVMAEPSEPALTLDAPSAVESTPKPIRTIGATGLAVAAKKAAGAVPPDSETQDADRDVQELKVADIAEPEPLQPVAPPVSAPMTTEMTLLPDVPDANDEPATDPIEAAIAEPPLEATTDVPGDTDVIVSADLSDETVTHTEIGTPQIVPMPMPANMRPAPPVKSTARYVAVTRPSGETRPAAAPVYSTQPETVYSTQPQTEYRSNYDGTSRFTASEVRSRQQRERIARQMFADNPNRRFVTFNLPNGQRETIYRYGGWDEGRYAGQGQRLDTFQNGEFYRSEAASRNQFTVLEGGWSRFTSSDGSFAEQLPSQRGNGIRLDLVN